MRLHRLQAVVDDLLVIRGAVHAEQVLQHVDRDVRPFLDQLGQVLADDLAGEVLLSSSSMPPSIGFRSHW